MDQIKDGLCFLGILVMLLVTAGHIIAFWFAVGWISELHEKLCVEPDVDSAPTPDKKKP